MASTWVSRPRVPSYIHPRRRPAQPSCQWPFSGGSSPCVPCRVTGIGSYKMTGLPRGSWEGTRSLMGLSLSLALDGAPLPVPLNLCEW